MIFRHCSPRSITTIPSTNQPRCAPPTHSMGQDSNRASAPMAQLNRPKPLSTRRPACVATKAPAAPARPIKPICPSFSAKGPLDNCNAMVENSTLTEANAKALTRVRWRSAGWVRNSPHMLDSTWG